MTGLNGSWIEVNLIKCRNLAGKYVFLLENGLILISSFFLVFWLDSFRRTTRCCLENKRAELKDKKR